MAKNIIYNYLERSEEVFDRRVERDIQANRKGDFELIIRDKNGELIENAVVSAKLDDLDFNFGANIFMLGEYKDDAKNRLFEEKFLNIFNSATLPLYWEGTEPVQNYLRYDESTPRDVPRRPPLDGVIKFCKEHGLKMKGHPLYWHEFVPNWLPERFEDLLPLLAKRFDEISKHCGFDVERFDVVNEPSRVYQVHMRDRRNGRFHLVPPDDYCLRIFEMARRYFPANTLILNDTVGASFTDFRGKYSGYYLNIKDLLSRGCQIDEIGMQCHLGADGPENVYDSEILYDILDTYADLGLPINISEISIPSRFAGEVDEDLQALAAQRLYKTCFSHKSVTGLTWWNMPDDGILVTKRKAGAENLPSAGLIDFDYNEKKAYKALKKLIKEEWTTNVTENAHGGVFKFNGFFGDYTLTVKYGDNVVIKKIRLDTHGSKVRSITI